MTEIAAPDPVRDRHMRSRTRTPLAAGALVVLALGAVVATVVATAPAATNCSPSSSWGTNRPDFASQVVTLVNQHRATIGRGPLSESATLTASSVWKSLHMANYGYFGHDDPAPPVSRSAFQRARDCDYAGSTWGENIAYGYTSPQSVMNGWLASPGHRANIESLNYTTIGVGVAANAGGVLYWTQNFGNDAGASPPTPPPPPAPAPPPPPPPAPAPTPPPPAPTPPPPSPTPPPAPAPAPAPGQPAPPAPAQPAPAQPAPAQPAPAPTAPAPTAPAPAAPTTEDGSLAVGGTPADVTTDDRRVAASVTFVELGSGKRFVDGDVRCRAEVKGRRLRVLANTYRGSAAHCEWRVPRWARGEKLTGVVAVQVGRAAAIRVFVRKTK